VRHLQKPSQNSSKRLTCANPAGESAGRYRRARRGRHAAARRRPRLAATALGSVTALAIGAAALYPLTRSGPPAAAAPASAELDASRGDARDVASRTFNRAEASAPASAAPSPSPVAPSPAKPARPKPVAGLTQAQMDNAAAIVEAGRRMNLPTRAHVVAITTVMQESNLRNLANPAVPKSLNLPHEGVDSNYDSVGLFQQRPSQGWGSAEQLMNPGESSRLFYNRLVKITGWETMSIGGAAQVVQRSAFPGAYDKHRARAQQIVAALA